jgi:hypothetical protein
MVSTMKKLFLPLIFCCLAASMSSAHAQLGRWLETNTWTGYGARTTDVFRVNADKWRLTFRNLSSDPLRVDLYACDGQLLKTVFNVEAPFRGHKAIKGFKGDLYLVISGVQARWEVTVEQYLTTVQEWKLQEILRTPRKPPRKLGVWHGTAGAYTYEIEVPRGSWRLAYEVKGKHGRIRVRVTPLSEGAPVPPVFSQFNQGMQHGWVHQAGKFRLEVEAIAGTEWRVEAAVR